MTPSQKVAAQLSDLAQKMKQCAFDLRHLNNVSARGYSAELDRAAEMVREWVRALELRVQQLSGSQSDKVKIRASATPAPHDYRK